MLRDNNRWEIYGKRPSESKSLISNCFSLPSLDCRHCHYCYRCRCRCLFALFCGFGSPRKERRESVCGRIVLRSALVDALSLALASPLALPLLPAMPYVTVNPVQLVVAHGKGLLALRIEGDHIEWTLALHDEGIPAMPRAAFECVPTISPFRKLLCPVVATSASALIKSVPNKGSWR